MREKHGSQTTRVGPLPTILDELCELRFREDGHGQAETIRFADRNGLTAFKIIQVQPEGRWAELWRGKNCQCALRLIDGVWIIATP